jgi:long-chain acyl-CoA synthetase
VELKLVDVPELGYLTSDKPYPRGEIIVRSDKVAPGYHRDIEGTREVFTSDGWYYTADIGEVYNGYGDKNPELLRLRIIDRKKNVYKLAMGEKFAPVDQSREPPSYHITDIRTCACVQ